MTLTEWAERWGLPLQALVELSQLPNHPPEPLSRAVESESAVQSLIRLEAAKAGWHLFRNNNGAGAVIDTKKLCRQCIQYSRRFIRWGLANDSSNLNEVVKSADLIGWRPRLITPSDIGHTIAQFVSRECKRPDWRFTGTPEEMAQARWHSMVLANGGDSAITNSEGSIK